MTPRRRRQAAEGLTDAQRRELLSHFEKAWSGSRFPSEDAKRRAWEAHREELLSEYIRENPGERPPAWWQFEAPEGYGPNRPRATVNDLQDEWLGYSPSVGNLVELGELTDEEAKALRARGPLWGG